MKIDYELIGQRIKEKRQEKGYSQEELAELIKASRSHIGNVESGQKGTSLEMIVNIANELGCSANDLLKDSLESLDDSITQADVILSGCTKEEKEFLTDALEALYGVLKSYTIK